MYTCIGSLARERHAASAPEKRHSGLVLHIVHMYELGCNTGIRNSATTDFMKPPWSLNTPLLDAVKRSSGSPETQHPPSFPVRCESFGGVTDSPAIAYAAKSRPRFADLKNEALGQDRIPQQSRRGTMDETMIYNKLPSQGHLWQV